MSNLHESGTCPLMQDWWMDDDLYLCVQYPMWVQCPFIDTFYYIWFVNGLYLILFLSSKIHILSEFQFENLNIFQFYFCYTGESL